MAIFKRQKLKNRDNERTSAAELTLRQSIYPLCLVTILFFLWVRWCLVVVLQRACGLPLL